MTRRLGKSSHFLIAAHIAAVLVLCLFGIDPCHAASIPAWLDEAISDWNGEHPAQRIEFVDIKDSYVWYIVPASREIGHKDVRASIYELVLAHQYKLTDQEELVTTGRPPTPTKPYTDKKCWRRSFLLDIEELSNTTMGGAGQTRGRAGLRQRMLTTLVCEDGPYWFAGFRVLQ